MSDFWLRKMETYFVRMDWDLDGTLSKNDFICMADILKKNGKLDEKRGSALTTLFVEIWETYYAPVTGGQPLSKDKYLATVKRMFGNPELNKTVATMFPIMFGVIDSNSDGVIDEKEFMAIYKLFGFNEEQARCTFQAMDTDHDGVLSLDEYVHAEMDYITGDDESSPFKYFWGPLV